MALNDLLEQILWEGRPYWDRTEIASPDQLGMLGRGRAALEPILFTTEPKTSIKAEAIIASLVPSR